MTNDEARLLVGILAAAYRQDLGDATVKAYINGLIDLNLADAQAAASRLVATLRFFPTVAELRAAVAEEIVGLPTPEAAWHQVETLLRAFPSAPDSAWSPPIAPHPLTWRVLREVDGLWNLARSETAMADRAHFLKLYADLREQEMVRAVADPGAYLEALAPAVAEMRAWQQGHVLAAAKPVPALPPGPPAPMPAEFREALDRLGARTKLPSG